MDPHEHHHRGEEEQQEGRRRERQPLKHEEFPQVDDGDDDSENEEEAGETADEEGDDQTTSDKVDRSRSGRVHIRNMIHRDPPGIVEAVRKLNDALDIMGEQIHENRDNGIRWVNPGFLPPLRHGQRKPMLEVTRFGIDPRTAFAHEHFFKIDRNRQGAMAWEIEYMAKKKNGPRHNFVDYTKHKYEYPEKLMEPPSKLGEYPKLLPFKDIMGIWPQDELDNPPSTIKEELIHFDYTNPDDLKAAEKFRDAKLPFKLINVPEVVAAGQKWTDEYVAANFDGGYDTNGPPADGKADESPDNFFAFFIPPFWSVPKMGIPPVRKNDWTYSKWSQHALYADLVGLSPNQPHFYWQAGVDKKERYKDRDQWTFISRDLPSFSSPTETFFVFEPESQKGIQCRFGERGVTAATHFDAGRNMVAMITGAKRYILSPPRECSKLGIVNKDGSSIFRHSMLNFGHLNHMDDPNMPDEEREWMETAGEAASLSTVLKAGEVLYIPSHWFHYITSIQKSAQCNVRSGVDFEGDPFFGGVVDVSDLCDVAPAQ
jgi:hypothetical protein